MKILIRLCALIPALFLAGCSPGGDGAAESSGGHVWQEQVDTIDKAEAATQAMLDAAEKQSRAIEQQAR